MTGVWKIHWKNGLFSRCFLGLGEDLIVHVEWAKHSLILIDLGENIQVHVDAT